VWFYALRGGIATIGDRTSAGLEGRRLFDGRGEGGEARIFGGSLARWRPTIRVTPPGRSTASIKNLSNASQKREHRDPFNPPDRRVTPGHRRSGTTIMVFVTRQLARRLRRPGPGSSTGGFHPAGIRPRAQKVPPEIRALTKRATPCAASPCEFCRRLGDPLAIGRRRADGAIAAARKNANRPHLVPVILIHSRPSPQGGTLPAT
jgi:hypothetical protein